MSELTKIWSGLEAETYTSILHFVLIEGEYDEIYMDNTTFKLIKRKGDEIDILLDKNKFQEKMRSENKSFDKFFNTLFIFVSAITFLGKDYKWPKSLFIFNVLRSFYIFIHIFCCFLSHFNRLF